MKTSILTIVLSSILFVPAAVAQVPAERASVTVRVADLDLSTEHGRAMLDSRIRQAAKTACGEASSADLAGSNALGPCRAQARSLAQARVNLIVASARRGATPALAAR